MSLCAYVDPTGLMCGAREDMHGVPWRFAFMPYHPFVAPAPPPGSTEATSGEAPVICTLRTLVISGRPQIDGCRAVDLTATNAQLRQAISDIRREAQIAMSFDGIEDMCNEALAPPRDDEKGG